MKALVFHGPGQTSWQDVPDPSVKDAADAIVRVDAVTICGTDLHIIKGDVPDVTPGRILGHEAVGTVVVVGAGPIGLAAVATARLYSPGRIIAVDLAAARLAAARDLGADATASADEEPERLVEDLTDGLGADVAIEAVGVPEAFEMCTRMVRPGGRGARRTPARHGRRTATGAVSAMSAMSAVTTMPGTTPQESGRSHPRAVVHGP